LLKNVRPSDSAPVAAATTGNNNRNTNVGYIIVINVLDATVVLVLPRNFRNSSLFTATCKISPTGRYTSAVNRMRSCLILLANLLLL
jgi:hypothetical protein